MRRERWLARLQHFLDESDATDLVSAIGGDPVDTGDNEVSDGPLLATYHLATLAPIGPADRFRLLAAPGPAARLDLLDDAEAMSKFRLS